VNKSTIGAQLYTLREFAKTAEDLDETLRKVKAIGYETVQVSGIGPIDSVRVKELTDKYGLSICATHVPFDRMKTDLDNLAEQHKLWDCRYVGLGSIPQSYRGSLEGYRAFAKEASEIAKRLADYGLKFVYHNHHFEFERFDGRTGMDILVEESDPEVFGLELDLYWVQVGGASPVDWIHKVKGRMDVVHLKDMAVLKEQQIFAEIGEGNLNWDAILKPAGKQVYNGTLSNKTRASETRSRAWS
jgi:sugar phosphate isomerase/epimerase